MIAQRVATRYLLASNIRILVDVPATKAVRERFSGHPEGVIAEFDSGLNLYRIFDGGELARIMSTGKITGGTYSVKAERAHGASWGENINQLVAWGNRERGKRLDDDIFLAKLDAIGFKFYHMDPEIGPIDFNGPDKQALPMNRSRIYLGTGASVMGVSLGDVELYRVDPDGQIHRLSPSEAKALVNKRPSKDVVLREIHAQLYQGSILGVDVRVWQDRGSWVVLLNDDRAIVKGAKTKDDAIELAKMGIKVNPSRPVAMPPEVLESRRKYDQLFEVEEESGKSRGGFGIKPKDRLTVLKGSPKLRVKKHTTLVVADVYQLGGDRRVFVKLVVGREPKTLYAIHRNQLDQPEFALMDSSRNRILVRKR